MIDAEPHSNESQEQKYHICVELGLAETMSEHLQSQLVTQLSYVYCSHRRHPLGNQINLYFSSFPCGADSLNEGLRNVLIRENADKWKVKKLPTPFWDSFPASKSIILTPDAPDPLLTVEADTYYMLGGLVDRTVKKNVTNTLALKFGIPGRRLPFKEFFVPGFDRPVLTVNQVFDILLHVVGNPSSWTEAFHMFVPRRHLDEIRGKARRRLRQIERNRQNTQLTTAFIDFVDALQESDPDCTVHLPQELHDFLCYRSEQLRHCAARVARMNLPQPFLFGLPLETCISLPAVDPHQPLSRSQCDLWSQFLKRSRGIADAKGSRERKPSSI